MARPQEPFASLDTLEQFRALLSACGVTEDVVNTETRLKAEDREFLDHYGAQDTVHSALKRNMPGPDDGSWREARDRFTDADWPAFQHFCQGLEHHYDLDWLLHEWVEACFQGLTCAPFPISASVNAAGQYTGPNPRSVGDRTVQIVECRSGGSAPGRVMDALAAARIPRLGAVGVQYLYHGTTHASAASILKDGINLRVCKPWGDFGQGFYLNPDGLKAAEWATKKSAAGRQYSNIAPPALLVFQDIRRDRPPGECMMLSGTSVPTWQEVIGVARTQGCPPLPEGCQTLWDDEYGYGSAFGSQVSKPRGAQGIWAMDRRDHVQYAIGKLHVARGWDAALVAIVFFLPFPGEVPAAAGGEWIVADRTARK